MKKCYQCGKPWDSAKRQPGPKDFCGQCDAYLHCCLNCRFYDPAVSQQCRIPNIENVADKEAGNFCDDFDFADRAAADPDDAGGEAARSRLDGLFGDAPAEQPGAKLDRFNDLFGD